MQASRWLNWTPENLKAPQVAGGRSGETHTSEPSATFATCHLIPIPENHRHPGGQDPSFWFDDFSRWALVNCLFRERCFGGVKSLHENFCDWCTAEQTVGCMLETFEELLESGGFLIAGGMVSGLILKEGLEIALALAGTK